MIIFSWNSFAKDAVYIDIELILLNSTEKYDDIENNRYDRSSYYYLTEEAKELLSAISQEENTDLFLYSTTSNRELKRTYRRFDLDEKGVSDILYKSVDNQSEYVNTIYFGNNTKDVSIKNEYSMTQKLMYFPSLDIAKEEFSDLRSRDQERLNEYFPKNINELETHKNNYKQILKVLVSRKLKINQNKFSNVDVKELLNWMVNGPIYQYQAVRTEINGERYNKFKSCELVASFKHEVDSKLCERMYPLELMWVGSIGRIAKCYSSRNNIVMDELANDACMSTFGYKHFWTKKNNIINGCEKRTTDNKLIIEKYEDINVCAKVLESKWQWLNDPSKKQKIFCGLTGKVDNKDELIRAENNIEKCIALAASDNQMQVEYNFTEKNKTITGCALTSVVDGYEIRTEDIATCYNNSKKKTIWLKDDKSNVVGCEVLDQKSNLKYPNISIDDCRKELGSEYNWIHDGKVVSGCSEMTLGAGQAGFTIEKLKDLEKCKERSGTKYRFIKDGKSVSCEERSNYRNLLIGFVDDMQLCINTNADELTITRNYNSSKTKLLTCSLSLKSGEALPSKYQKTCPEEKRFVKDDDNEFIQGCFSINPDDGFPINKLQVEECLDPNRKIEYAFLYSKDAKNIIGCYEQDLRSKLPILDLKVDDKNCFESNDIRNYWKGTSRDICQNFVKNKDNGLWYLIGKVQKELCDEKDELVLFDRDFNAYISLAREKYDETKSYEENVEINEPNWHKFSKGLRTQFTKMLLKTDREILTFNYRKSDLLTGNGLSLPKGKKLNIYSKIAIDYANEWQDAIWKYLPNEGGMVGWGLYTSNNPVGSSSYGDTLVAVKLPKDSIVLDIRKISNGRIPMTKDAYDILKLLPSACRSGAEYEDAAKTIVRVYKDKLTSCIEGHFAFVKTLSDLKVNAIAYPWGSHGQSGLSGCEFSEANYATFVVVDTPLNRNTVSIVNKYGSENETAEELDLYSKINAYFRITTGSISPFHKSAKKDITIDELNSWKKEKLFSCMRENKNDYPKAQL